jgi:hypothetical protein
MTPRDTVGTWRLDKPEQEEVLLCLLMKGQCIECKCVASGGQPQATGDSCAEQAEVSAEAAQVDQA